MSTRISLTEANDLQKTYDPRNETENFIEEMEFLLEDNFRASIMLAGISACETMKLFESNIFYEYDLTKCTRSVHDVNCEINHLNDAMWKAYETYGSPTKNIAVFRHVESLKTCFDITKLNVLWSVVDGRKFHEPPINVILLYEENFPRVGFSEKFTFLSYFTSQRTRCREEFRDNDFNAQAFASRMKEFQVEQEPESTECQLNIDYTKTKNPDPEQFWLQRNIVIVILVFLISLFGYLIFKKQLKKK